MPARSLDQTRPALARALKSAAAAGPLTQRDLAALLRDNRDKWRLPARTGLRQFLEFSLARTDLRRVELRSKDYRPITRYVWGDPSAFELALSIRGNAYLSHGTAVFLRGLSDEIPKVVYVNSEQSAKPGPAGELTQAALDRAFANQQRRSKLVFTYDDTRIMVLSGKNTGQLEVGALEGPAGERLRVTKTERTLIDIVVRPAYAGGMTHVLQVFENARPRVSTNVLIATLRKLDYTYPYHQAIGFLMERAGYGNDALSRLEALGLRHDFYLVHGMRETEFSRRWRLHHPKGF